MATEGATELLEERPLRELVSTLARDTSELLEKEVALAKQEAKEKVDEIQTHLLSLSTGAMVMHVGLLAVVAALILLLAQTLPDWVAALLVGAVFCLVGGVMFWRGKEKLQQTDLKPEKTTESVKRDVKAIKEAAQ
jgi:hypothetical protein